MAEIQEVFDRLVAENQDKNAIIMTLANECGIDVTSAVREYQRMAKAGGLILNNKDRTLQIDLMLADVDITDPNVRRSMVETISDKFDIGEATAMQHIRTYAEANSVELPSSTRTPFVDLVAFVKERIDQEKPRAEIVTDMIAEFGYSENSAASAYSRVLKELGLSTGRAGNTFPLADLVTLIRANEHLPKKTLITKICEEAGYAESTANSFLIYLNFAKEYARQVLFDAPTSAPAKTKRSKNADETAA
jgi:hypothetical protein